MVNVCGLYRLKQDLLQRLLSTSFHWSKNWGSSWLRHPQLPRSVQKVPPSPYGVEDAPMTAFITAWRISTYKKIPFGLKNVGVTYQQLVDKIFQKHIGQNVEIYVDVIVIKSPHMKDYTGDLTETLDTLRSTNLKLNPAKCTFRVSSRKFLRHVIFSEGLRANPTKVNILATMRSPSTVKKVQALTRTIAV